MNLNQLKRLENFKNYKYGFFIHYVWGGGAYTLTLNPDGSAPEGLEDLANKFDVETFADNMQRIGVQYVIFTVYHAAMNLLYPSTVMKQYFPAHCAKRDLIGEVIAALKKRNIDVVLYTHPRDGHDLTEEEGKQVGWFRSVSHEANCNSADPDFERFDFAKWNDFINDIYAEIVDRYGDDVIGLYIDDTDILRLNRDAR